MTQAADRAVQDNRSKASRAIRLVRGSLNRYQPLDPSVELEDIELEPYDALANRFVRAVECSLRLFRSLEISEFGETSDTTRDTLDRMEKLGWVSSSDTWLAMRGVRNRIVHDYLPEVIAKIFSDIAGRFGDELSRLLARLEEPSH